MNKELTASNNFASNLDSFDWSEFLGEEKGFVFSMYSRKESAYLLLKHDGGARTTVIQTVKVDPAKRYITEVSNTRGVPELIVTEILE